MSEQYFSTNPQSKSDPKTWNYILKGIPFTFTSDHGVFSKNEVDFGSRLLIETFTEPEVDGGLLDLGCGYGPIGLALAKAFPTREVTLSDVNERALDLAKHNAVQNNVGNVKFMISDRLQSFQGQCFSAIVTNPPIRAGKNVIFQMYEESYNALVSRGELWIVIQKKQGAPSTKKKLETMFEDVEVVKKDKGYLIIRARKSNNS